MHLMQGTTQSALPPVFRGPLPKQHVTGTVVTMHSNLPSPPHTILASPHPPRVGVTLSSLTLGVPGIAPFRVLALRKALAAHPASSATQSVRPL